MLNAHSIVFIHIGTSFPEHVTHSISQARLFNKECPIYLIAYGSTLAKEFSKFAEFSVTPVPCESLQLSEHHLKFRNCKSHNFTANGFWVYTSERFFYLDDFVRQYNLSDVFHLENDVMLYTDLSDHLSSFQKYYKGMIGATFENDTRCVPGFVYISNSKPLGHLVDSFPDCVLPDTSEMATIAKFKDSNLNVYIDYLPVVPSQYIDDHKLELSKVSKEFKLYSNHFEDFASVFDAAAFGVYLGGWDSYAHPETGEPGQISPHSNFNASYFDITWKIDGEGRRIPFITYKGKQTRINNLHITNKVRIPAFHSLYKN